MDLKIGVDLGDIEINAGIVDKKGKVLKSVSVLTEAKKGKDVVLANVNKAIELVLKFKKFRKIPSIGVAVSGQVNTKTGTIIQGPSLPLKNIQIKKILKNKFKTDVFVENSANCFILGEFLYGSGKGHLNILGLTLGTNVEGGIIINGEPYSGDGNAGKFGQMTIKFNGLLSNCGNDGSLEEYVSRRGLMRLAESFGMRKVDGPQDIFKLALKNDLNSITLLKEMGVYVGIQIANLINAFDPEKVIVGGEFADAWNFFGPHLKEEVKKRALFKANVVKCKLGKRAVLIGASSLVE